MNLLSFSKLHPLDRLCISLSVLFIQLLATRECAISEEDLKNKPYFKEVLMKFVSWIDDMVKLAKKRHGTPFVPG